MTEETHPPTDRDAAAGAPWRDRRQRPRAWFGRLRQFIEMHTSHPLTELLDAEVGGGRSCGSWGRSWFRSWR